MRPPPLPPAPPPKQELRRLRWVITGLAIGLVISGAVAIVSSALQTSAPGPSQAGSVGQVPAPPEGVRLKVEALRVIISWLPPSTAVSGFQIIRNGQPLGFAGYPGASYTDRLVAPGQEYTYEVKELSSEGVSSTGTEVTIFTPTAPPSTARLSGIFRVNLKITSSFGDSGASPKEMAGLNFKAKCAVGACDVLWAAPAAKGMAGTLSRLGGVYTGSVSTKFNMTCGGVLVPSNFLVRVQVVQAAVVSGRWLATEIQGTFTERTPGVLNCVDSGIDYAFKGVLIPSGQ